jgi:hypothetical protein
MEDPLSRALEAPHEHLQPAPERVDRHTSRPRTIADVLNDVTQQALAAFDMPFFDGGGASNCEPILKAGSAEAGTVHISAQRHDPPYRAELTLYVRSDLVPPDDAHSHVRGRCSMSRNNTDAAPLHHDFAIAVAIGDDGTLTIDVAQLRAELAEAVRAFG